MSVGPAVPLHSALAVPALTLDAVLARQFRRLVWRSAGGVLLVAALLAAFAYVDAFSPARYGDALHTVRQLAADAWPPDFSRWPGWGRPLAQTLAMSVAGSVLGLVMALPLGSLAARTLCPAWLAGPMSLLLHALRSLPVLVWGIVFVAAVGFGPLPGVLAMGCHSAGMLGKFWAEMLEHVEPGPANALRSQGVSRLGVLRFAVVPQVLPRMVDVLLYRWEHNLRAATTLGVVGAGGLGLEIVTAFHLFEYREASALILVLLGLVTLINVLGARVRHLLVGRGISPGP